MPEYEAKISLPSFSLTGVQYQLASVHDRSTSLSVRERKLINNAVQKRINEYSTGRYLARQLLRQFNITEFDLLPGESREPLWPEHIVGSITHTDTYAAVALARKSAWLSIGIDMQAHDSVDSRLKPRLLTEHERRRYGQVDPSLIFSAKEACYKFLFPIVGEFVDYLSVEVDLDESRREFQLRYCGKSRGNLIANEARGQYVEIDAHWFCIVSADAQ